MTTLRRARPLLGTLTEIGVATGATAHHGDDALSASCAPCALSWLSALDAAFAAMAVVERHMSQQRNDNDLAALNASAPGVAVPVDLHTSRVLARALAWHGATGGAFDASCCTARGHAGFAVDGLRAWRTAAGVQLSLDGIAKGYAVDCAVAVLQARGCHAGWVNAGGDLRAFGDIALPVTVRIGSRTRDTTLTEGALATSDFGRARRTRSAWTRRPPQRGGWQGASVRAPECALADAMTKVALAAGREAAAITTALGATILWRA